MPETSSLLQKIQQAAGCMYLSDLRNPGNFVNQQTKDRLMEIPLNEYSLVQWNQAASYICGKTCRLASPEEARNLIGQDP